jgi:TetR/AcrR family hemagglutinin/protease transcriptional regulator
MARTRLPRRPRAPRLDQHERRALLLRSALRVFARRGLSGARHTEIAREAGVSVPTVFFYFPTRDALVRGVLDEVARFYEDMARRIHASDRPAPDVIIDHMRAFADSVTTHADYACVLLEWSTAIRSEAWPLYLRFQEKILANTAATIRRWRIDSASPHVDDSADDARVLAATGYVLAQMKITRVPAPRVERFLETVVRDVLGHPAAAGQPQPQNVPTEPQPLQQSRSPH